MPSWIAPTIAGVAGLCLVAGVAKAVRDFRNWRQDRERPREKWENDPWR
ncbi:MAG: hypothetical protein L0215_26745 [Gemmataceae bacterium]|nr:hypothetical protein [Gemmataceae bacterium]